MFCIPCKSFIVFLNSGLDVSGISNVEALIFKTLQYVNPIYHSKKPPLFSRGFCGDDEARTRDLRRDRPAF